MTENIDMKASASAVSRIEWIDAVKGLGIILIMVSHVDCLPFELPLTAGYVSMFFVLSGYTFKEDDFKKGMIKKSKRLLIPYFIYGILAVLLYLFVSSYGFWRNCIGLIYSRYSFYPLNVEDNYLFLRFDSPLWFVTTMFMAYLWTYIYALFSSKKGRFTLAVVYILITVLCANLPILLPWSIDISFIASLFIIVGREITKTSYFRIKSKRIDCLLVACLAIVCLPLVYYNGWINMSVRIYGEHDYVSILYFFIIGVFTTLIYGSCFRILANTLITRLFAKIGGYSLTLMCIHMPIIILLEHAIFRHIDLNRNVMNLLAIVLIIILAISFHNVKKRFFQHSPILKYL